MVANTTDHTRLDERDDMQHIQTQRLLALRVIAPPKSRLGTLIDERLAQLYERLGEEIDPAKRRERTAANQDSLSEKPALKESDRNNAPSMGGVAGAPGMLSAQTVPPGAAGTQLQDRAAMKDPASREFKVPKLKDPPKLSQKAAQQQTQQQQTQQQNWVWILSQILQTDLKRLGFEPDELDDIRLLLIKSEATQFEKLQLLSRLPDSLAPEAVTKIFEDIRTMAAGYVAFVLVERVKSEMEKGGELQQMPEVPRSVSSSFYGIPLIDFDPEEVLKRLG
jgi:hypothetical protein